jgi:class 3 adenylate cyclase
MDPHRVTSPTETPQPEMAHVLFMDVVGYGKLKMREQLAINSQLTDMVRNTSEYRRDEGTDSFICRPTGDGMAVIFFSNPIAPIRCAIEISGLIRRQESIRLRMGIHSGLVFRHKDINQQPDVTGQGIIIAQRVMDIGDANHILLSQAIAEMLLALGDWNDHISELGLMEVKHAEQLFVYNFSSDDFGNPNPPKKRVSEGQTNTRVRSAGSSLSSDRSTPSINSEAFGNQRNPSANDLPQTNLRNCGGCGMLLHRNRGSNSVSCRYCGYKN